jgi:DUF1009 family protein
VIGIFRPSAGVNKMRHAFELYPLCAENRLPAKSDSLNLAIGIAMAIQVLDVTQNTVIIGKPVNSLEKE